jgi:hypothetical protein
MRASVFYQDVPPELAAEALKLARVQSEARMGNRRRFGPGPRSPRGS